MMNTNKYSLRNRSNLVPGKFKKSTTFIHNVRALDPLSRHFISEAIAMFKLNFQEFEVEIIPTTTKAFNMTLKVDNYSIMKSFSAAQIKGVKGTYQLASMISKAQDYQKYID